MASKETLMAEIRRLQSEKKELKESAHQRMKDFKDYDEKIKTTIDSIRKLCETILAKDVNEMPTGINYSWSSIPVDELIKKSSKSLEKYNKEKNGVINELIDLLSDKNLEIQSVNEEVDFLKEKIDDYIQTAKKESSNISVCERQVKVEEVDVDGLEDGESDFEDAPIENDWRPTDTQTESLDKKSTIGERQQTQNSAAAKPKKERNSTKKESDAESRVHKKDEEIEKGIAASLLPNTKYYANKAQKERKKQRKKRSDAYVNEKVSDVVSNLNNPEKMILFVIGTKGLSEKSDIMNMMQELKKEEDPMFVKIIGKESFSESRLNNVLNTLEKYKFLKKEIISGAGLDRQFSIYLLTEMGKKVFYCLFSNEEIVECEADKIKREHDNYLHGYGIKLVADILKQQEGVVDVDYFTRRNPVTLENGEKYIPDIIVTYKYYDHAKNKYFKKKLYIEYELGTHSDSSFFSKLSKMQRCTNELYFVCGNDEISNRVNQKIKKWINNNNPKGIFICVSSRACLRGKNIFYKNGWKYVFEPKYRGTEAKTNF